ncbi:aldehyde dehydrogenase family protein [Reichenbachiella agarivorans]|uniref:Aldehyde dehydrogenase family protein n=1 Tax=Reichenbachiella agarivorans TaxID=2979464 RepID=A0ABY6CTD7_9BACT|nr:aldehyde dehydrogenase family protein [Reichenbachiella agarivorans]UXP33791.1 aldehyde dehydrogenase family protein [Reichenbachiella agarivorans]
MATLKIFSPFDQSLIKEIPFNTAEEVLGALDRAHRLFHDRSQWLGKHERVKILENIIFLMEERYDELVFQSAQEGGKPLIDTKVEMDRAINGVKLAIQYIGQQGGYEVPMGQTASSVNRMAYTMREPIGVVASISAFNHPINLMIHQTIPAIAVGAPVIYKPASVTPLTALLMQEIYDAAGLPKGWCTTIVCEREVTEQLVSSEKINFMSFIGSAQVGWSLRSKLAPGTRCALEHGGAAPVIVEPDADRKEMIPALTKGGFYHAGQVCVSVQKIFVHESIMEEVLEELDGAARSLIVGDPLLEETEVGPLIQPQEVERIETWILEAKKLGAKVVCGGERISDTCFAPTILLNPSEDSKVSTEEIFGPVICLYSYTDRNEAISRANGLRYAFQAAVFTKELNVALDTVKKLNATTVMVNDHTAFRVDWMPFGGRDQSGLGLGSIPHTMLDMTREKLMVIKSAVL